MALVISINTCVKTACSVLTFRDTTGIYNVSTNQGGYGSPNPEVGDFTTATLKITAPDGTEYNLDLVALSAGFPSNNVDYEYIIPANQIGNRTVIEDGLWEFLYTIDDGATSYIANKQAIYTCNSNCCVKSMLLNIDPLDASIQNKVNYKKIQDYNKAFSFLESLKYYAFCGNLDKFNNIKLVIDKICAKSNCKTCN